MAKKEGASVREVIVDPDTKARLENQAFLARSTVSELVREILEAIVRDEYEDAREKNPVPVGRSRIGLLVDDQLWEASDEVAWRRRMTRSALVRLVADHLYGDLPTDRTEVKR